MRLEHSLIPYTKVNSKEIKNLNVRPNAIKHFEENMEWLLIDINCSNVFSKSSPRDENKHKNKWDLLKLKIFYMEKEIMNKMKKDPQDGQNNFKRNN